MICMWIAYEYCMPNSGKAGTSKSKTVITANATDCAVGPKKGTTQQPVFENIDIIYAAVIAHYKNMHCVTAKRPSWDIKGKLADMTELYERQHMELTEHKQKTKVLDDILRRLDVCI